MSYFVARVIRDIGAFPLLRNVTKPQPEATRIIIGMTRRQRRNPVQCRTFCMKHQSFYCFSLRYAVTGGQPFQGPFGVYINNQVQALTRAVLIYQMPRTIRGLPRCIALCHVVTALSLRSNRLAETLLRNNARGARTWQYLPAASVAVRFRRDCSVAWERRKVQGTATAR